MQSWRSPHGRPLPIPGGRTLIMGVLNVTPDSFSDGGQLPTPQAVVDRAGEMIAGGADVLDIGGESTRPNAEAVSAGDELSRVLPAIEAVRGAFPSVPVSIDTYKAPVADAAIAAGADIINDVWGLLHGASAHARAAWWRFARGETREPPHRSPMADVAARCDCPVILMHNRLDRNYTDFWGDVLRDFKTSLAAATVSAVAPHQIWLDPGFGFAKNPPHNLEVLRELHRIVDLGFPVLVGTSRKSTLGVVLGTAVEDRLEAGGATVVWAVQQGCQMIRVHDVREMARFARMADAIKAGLGFSPS
jgi:dihydropteroate synthase